MKKKKIFKKPPKNKRGNSGVEWWTQEYFLKVTKKVGKKSIAKSAKKVMDFDDLEETPSFEKSIKQTIIPYADYKKRVLSRRKLMEHFKSGKQIAFAATKRMRCFIGHHGIERDDFDQIVMMSLWWASVSFDPSRIKSFNSFAWVVCKHFTHYYLNKFYIKLGEGIPENISLDDLVAGAIRSRDKISAFDSACVNEIIELNFKLNSKRNATMLIQREFLGLSLQEIADIASLTRQRVQQIVAKSLKLLKNSYHSGKVKLIS